MAASLIPDSETNEFIQSHLRHWLEHMGDKLSKETQELLQAQMKLNEDFVGPNRATRVKEFLRFIQSPIPEYSSASTEREVEIRLASEEELANFDPKLHLAPVEEDTITDNIPLEVYFSDISQYGGRCLKLHRFDVPSTAAGSFYQGDCVKDLADLKKKTPLIMGAIATLLMKEHTSQGFTREGRTGFYANLGGKVSIVFVKYYASQEKFLMRAFLTGYVKLNPTDRIFHLPQPVVRQI